MAGFDKDIITFEHGDDDPVLVRNGDPVAVTDVDDCLFEEDIEVENVLDIEEDEDDPDYEEGDESDSFDDEEEAHESHQNQGDDVAQRRKSIPTNIDITRRSSPSTCQVRVEMISETQCDNNEGVLPTEEEPDFDVADLHNLPEDEEEDEEWHFCNPEPKKMKKRPVHYVPDDEVPNIAMEVIFKDCEEFKEGIMKLSVIEGKKVRHVRNEKLRQNYECDSQYCTWQVGASWDNDWKSFMIKKIQPEHTCVGRNARVDVDCNYLAKYFYNKVSMNPATKVQDMVDAFKEKYDIDVSWHKCRRAKKQILSEMKDNFKQQYLQLRAYGEYLLSLNKGNIVRVQCIREAVGVVRFQRIYVAFGVIKEGWKKGCRRVMGVDGCFLKGPCKGILLSAVGRDGNNQMYPIAWAIVESENTDSWKWFFELLKEDLDLGTGRQYCIISDQHRGLITAREEILPSAEHRFCVRHVYACFCKRWGGSNDLRLVWWACAKSTFKQQFDDNMAKLRQKTQGGYEEMMKMPGKFWCRAFIETFSFCERVDNNLAECFNSKILKPRELPIISCLRGIETYCMEKIRDNYSALRFWKSNISPAAEKLYNKAIECARNNQITWDGWYKFQVDDGKWLHICNFSTSECTCRVWQMTGVPCQHVVCAARELRWDPIKFVNPYYSREKYVAAWGKPLELTRGPEMWRMNVTGDVILPPPMKKVKGRPQKKRRKGKNEPKKVSKDGVQRMSKEGKEISCSLCKTIGHNKTTCKKRSNLPSQNAPSQSDHSQTKKRANASSSNVASQTAPSTSRKRANANDAGNQA